MQTIKHKVVHIKTQLSMFACAQLCQCSVVRQCTVFDKTFCFFHFVFSELRVENELTWLGL